MELKNLSTALSLLNYFTPETPRWGIRALAKQAQLPSAVVQRILATYAQYGFLERNPNSDKAYQLGMRFYELGQQVSARLKFADLIDPLLSNLAIATDETVYLNWLNQLSCICIAVQNSPNSIHLAVERGSRMPLHAGAAAKVILANFDAAQFDLWSAKATLTSYTDQTETQLHQLQQSCLQIRQQGFAYSTGELIPDSFGLAVPVFSHSGHLFGSLALSGPKYRFQPQKLEELIGQLKQTVNQIQPVLSYFS